MHMTIRYWMVISFFLLDKSRRLDSICNINHPKILTIIVIHINIMLFIIVRFVQI